MTPNPTQLMLIEDHPDYRDTISMAVSREADFNLAFQFGTAEEALRNLQNVQIQPKPDLILLDLNLPGMSGIEAIPWIKEYVPSAKIIVLTQSNRESDVMEALSAGANSYLLKSASRLQIFEAIRTVIGGGAVIDPDVAAYLLQTLRVRPTQSKTRVALSNRELQTLSLLAEGMVQKEISSELGITPNTVATHIRRIYDKLQVQNAAAAINEAHKRGIFSS